MPAQIHSVAVRGIEGFAVLVELDLANGLPGFVTVGLPDSAVREARERVASAVRNSGFQFPQRRITVNLAPAQARKEGTHFDLPIALAVLSASGQIPAGSWSGRYCFIGELALDGGVRPVAGALAMALQAKVQGFEAIIVPAANAAEARASGLPAYGAGSLREVAGFLSRGEVPADLRQSAAPESDFSDDVDFLDVKGQSLAKRALEIAAAGGHNVLLMGTPGVGKSMLARRFVTLLPRLTPGESMEVTRIHSVCRKNKNGMVTARPFRAPHHTASRVSLVGGGAAPRPGEASLAHGGVLFLDELAEFDRGTLEALRQPLEDYKITVARAKDVLEYPARFILVAASNPCPCGYRGHPERECVCTPPVVRKYLARLSGPLLDRIDIQVELSPLPFAQWEGSEPESPQSSAQIRSRVERARLAQRRRFKSLDFAVNAYIPANELRKACGLDERGLRVLEAASKKMSLSARGLDRALKVARTIADLADSGPVLAEHLTEALQFRTLDQRQQTRS